MDETQPEQPEQPKPQDQAPSPQRRLQQLRSIPERDRTDAEWDEMNELEIMLASSNRAGAPDPNVRRDAGGHRPQQQQQRQGHGGGPRGGGQGGHQQRNRQNRGGRR